MFEVIATDGSGRSARFDYYLDAAAYKNVCETLSKIRCIIVEVTDNPPF